MSKERLPANVSKVLAVFRAHPNRALAPDEVKTILGKVKFDVIGVMRILSRNHLIYECPDEVHTVTGATADTSQFTQTRYRLEP